MASEKAGFCGTVCRWHRTDPCARIGGELGAAWSFFCWAVGRPTVDGQILAPVDAYGLQGFNHAGFLPSIVLPCTFFRFFLADPAERERERETRIQKGTMQRLQWLWPWLWLQRRMKGGELYCNGIFSRDSQLRLVGELRASAEVRDGPVTVQSCKIFCCCGFHEFAGNFFGWEQIGQRETIIFWRPWRNSGRNGSKSAWNRQFSWGSQQICVRKTAVLPPNVMQELGNKIDIAKPTVVLISVAQRSSSLGGMEHFWEVRSWIYLNGESGIYCPTEATHVSGWV